MDRLSTLTLVVVAAAACESRSDRPAGEPSSRTNGAKVNVARGASTEAFCDVHASDAQGAVFHWPELGGAKAPAATGWRWVNIWATWCKPCVEEMPRLVVWRNKLAASGRPIELTFVSVDDSDADVDEFRKSHPETAVSIRLADADKRAEWLRGFGMADSAIPIHLFVSPANRLRCARAGEIREKDYSLVDKLLAE